MHSYYNSRQLLLFAYDCTIVVFLQTIGSNYTVKAVSGQELFLMEVIAFILKFLKNQLLTAHEKGIQTYKATDFDWVITVPAIWKDRGKQMMREAAYMVCD